MNAVPKQLARSGAYSLYRRDLCRHDQFLMYPVNAT